MTQIAKVEIILNGREELTKLCNVKRPYGNLPCAIPRLQPQTELSNFPLNTRSHIPFRNSTY